MPEYKITYKRKNQLPETWYIESKSKKHAEIEIKLEKGNIHIIRINRIERAK